MGTLRVLNQYKPEITWIQKETELNRPRAYTTTNSEDVIRVLLQKQEQIQEMELTHPPQAPCTQKTRYVIILHHIAQGKDQALMPQRAIQQPKKPSKRAAPQPLQETLSDDEENQALVKAAEEAEKTTHQKKSKKEDSIGPSSSTNQTNEDGNKQTRTSPVHALSPTTTEHTTASSTPQTRD